jgi:hypothetical protein
MKQAEAATTMRHVFAIKVLDRLPGMFGARRYLYHCARCKWSFIINDGRRGVLTPLADNGTPLSHDEAVARAATFALGPCPAMHRLADVHAHIGSSNGHVSAVADPAHRLEARTH